MKKIKRYLIMTTATLLFMLIFLGIISFTDLMSSNWIIGTIALFLGSFVFSEGMNSYTRRLNKYLKYKDYKVKVGDTVFAYNNRSDTVYVIGKLESISYDPYNNETSYSVNNEEFSNALYIEQIDSFDSFIN